MLRAQGIVMTQKAGNTQPGGNEKFSFEVIGIYPNPVIEKAQFKFKLHQPGDVTVKVYDLVGNEIAKIVDDHFTTGKHEVKYDAKDLNPGVYFYSVSMNGNTIIKRFVKKE